jgi:ArsR family transcriptional regulator, zinc-responsive transcriptional repressor
MRTSRRKLAEQCVAAFDLEFFRTLCEPARLNVLRELMVLGRADIAAVAANLPQDRSVVARHLKQLEAVNVVAAKKEGRHVYYEIDPAGVKSRMDGLMELVHMVQSFVVAPMEKAGTGETRR